MDVNVIYGGESFQKFKFEETVSETLELLGNLKKFGVKYLNILFHDHYFTDSFDTWKKWYLWSIDYLKNNGFTFISFRDAIKELESVGHFL